MMLEQKLKKLERLHSLLQEEEKLLLEVDLMNQFQNNKFTSQQCIVKDELEKLRAKTSAQGSCGNLISILEALGLEASNKYHIINGDFIEIHNNRIFYVHYPYNVYGGMGSTPLTKDEITVEDAISALKSYHKI
ncbi:hypothetical protein [Clostridium brassicae]|uniref:Uncharacterized protein n=1 Tax=Clostridium brassicae TaxID=2999072 RepID=A0ABT4D6F1_9CLOT|nr:hypothetical protein [Clostridium brassicae]MCY6957881.1 hypothetical protein [Clostridium brassicae]